MAMDFIGLSVGMGYTDETVIGGGALKGKNCVVSNIEEVADGVNVTFQSILDDGTVKTDTAFIPKGTQDAELIDARIDKDGNTHVNVGEHIRTVSSQLSSEIVELKESDAYTNVYQLFNPNGEAYFEKRWNASGGTSNAENMVAFAYRNPIVGKKYISNIVSKASFFLNSKANQITPIVVDEYFVYNNTYYSVFTVIEGCDVIMLTLSNKVADSSPILVETDKAIIFDKKQYAFGELVYREKKDKPLKGVKYASIGDSITYYDELDYIETTEIAGSKCKGYQSYVADLLGVEKINMGYSGKNSNYMVTQVNATDFSDIGIVSIMSGMNDGGQNVSIETYKANLVTMVTKILTDNPLCKVFLLSPTFGRYKQSKGVYTDGWVIPDYANAMREVAESLNIPFYDNYHNNGINKLNYHKYMADIFDTTTYKIHPNTMGYKIIGTQVANFMYDKLVCQR